mmetsp:Transcript_32219/g.54328  ORF Transcript_32219/g.54328 Transcript_32219/m.54328 type:complete len:107 (+) Transcript_32219:1-321(+)
MEEGNCCRWQEAEERRHDNRLAMSYDGDGAREHGGVENIGDSSGAVDQEHECAHNFVGDEGAEKWEHGGETTMNLDGARARGHKGFSITETAVGLSTRNTGVGKMS